MASRTLSQTFGQSRLRVIKETRLRSPCVRAAVIDAPTAVPDDLEALPDEHGSMYAQFDELLKGTVTSFRVGSEVRGTVVDVSRKGAFVDIGGKGAAFAATHHLCIAPVIDVRSSPQATLMFSYTSRRLPRSYLCPALTVLKGRRLAAGSS